MIASALGQPHVARLCSGAVPLAIRPVDKPCRHRYTAGTSQRTAQCMIANDGRGKERIRRPMVAAPSFFVLVSLILAELLVIVSGQRRIPVGEAL